MKYFIYNKDKIITLLLGLNDIIYLIFNNIVTSVLLLITSQQ